MQSARLALKARPEENIQRYVGLKNLDSQDVCFEEDNTVGM